MILATLTEMTGNVVLFDFDVKRVMFPRLNGMTVTEKQQLAKTAAHWYKECERLQQRIAKAREILVYSGGYNQHKLGDLIREALEALEGK